MSSFNIQCMLSKTNISNQEHIVIVPLFKVRPHVSNFVQHINLKDMYEKANDSLKTYLKKHVPLFQNESFPETYRVNIDMQVGHTLHPGEHWQIGLPMEAIYNDQGSFLLPEGQEHQLSACLFLHTIKHQGIKATRENYAYSRINFNPENLPLHDPQTALLNIQEAAWQNQLFIAQRSKGDALLYARTYIAVSFACIDKQVYTYALMQKKDLYDVLCQQIEEHLEHVIPFLEEESYYYSPNRDRSVPYDFTTIDKLKEKQELSFSHSHSENFNFYYSELDISPINFMQNIAQEGLPAKYVWKKDAKEQYRNTLLKKAEIFCINDFMANDISEIWNPIHICGQNMCDEKRLAFNKAIDKICHDKINQRIV